MRGLGERARPDGVRGTFAVPEVLLLYWLVSASFKGVPTQTVIIPPNSLFGLYLLYVALSVPFTVFLLTGFFRNLPEETEEAAARRLCARSCRSRSRWRAAA
ncbi:hypothetical protein ACFWYW_41945 [Nonomuraea sp. NPDC059023]|uniref:hypothetical protein n=1 Tax=unclassified Nonomuraea TaxID=2593643 RepID=UPI00368D558A